MSCFPGIEKLPGRSDYRRGEDEAWVIHCEM